MNVELTVGEPKDSCFSTFGLGVLGGVGIALCIY